MPIHRSGRWLAEVALAVVAAAVFLGFLGSLELWGKREQRASAEAIDTVDQGHWLVAQIQGRPRLEKPPLPRLITSGLILATGRRDEAIVRLPNALAAILTVGLVYWLGRKMAGRSVGLAAGFAMASSAYFVVEMRQAGNDGLLTLFCTLAMLAAWERLHGREAGSPGHRGWNLVLYLALGLGFLTKGPVIVLLVGVAVVGFLATSRQVGSGLRLLVDVRGFCLFLALALAWPVPVLVGDPGALRVWWQEIGQKAGGSGIVHGNDRGSVVLDWFWMTLPWTPLALLAAAWPVRRSSREGRPWLGFAWWWAFGNLAVLGLWSVAKPSYYLPCLPAVALLVGAEWVRIARLARVSTAGSGLARVAIQASWVVPFVVAIVAPVAAPIDGKWLCLAASALALSSLAAAWAWRKGSDFGPIACLSAGLVAVALVGYGIIAPAENDARGHRKLAADLGHILPDSTSTVWFFDELDEGVWFYLKGPGLAPIPAGRPRYNRGFDLHEAATARKLATPEGRVNLARDQLVEWARHADPASPYLLIRAKILELPTISRDLAPLVEPVYREEGVKRNAVVLLRARTTVR